VDANADSAADADVHVDADTLPLAQAAKT